MLNDTMLHYFPHIYLYVDVEKYLLLCIHIQRHDTQYPHDL